MKIYKFHKLYNGGIFMNEFIINEKDEIVMKLIHYFTTVKGYNPIILHGGKDEIWLENMDEDYKIVRIVSGYIHNNEQYTVDKYKTAQIVKQIKRKTFTFDINTLNIYVNLGDNVKIEPTKKIDSVYISDIDDIDKYDLLKESFPNLKSSLETKEKGLTLFSRLTNDINESNEKKAKQNQDIFSLKKPYITYALIIINLLVYVIGLIIGQNWMVEKFGLHPELVKSGEYYRLITCIFMHANIIHLISNMYALYVIGTQVENFFNKWKFSIIYLVSGIIGSFFSMIFTQSWSVGASGAIFGLMGALLFFGYHHRVYLGSVIKSQIIPVIVINLVIGFSSPGIDNAAHIGGLIGGMMGSMMLGVKDRKDKSEQINGVILTTILLGFLFYISFFIIK